MICHFEGTKIGVFWLHCSARLLLPVTLDGYSLEECLISPGISQGFIHDHLLLHLYINPLTANPTKWSNTLKQFVGKSPTNCLSLFDHFVKLALKELMIVMMLSVLVSSMLMIILSTMNLWHRLELVSEFAWVLRDTSDCGRKLGPYPEFFWGYHYFEQSEIEDFASRKRGRTGQNVKIVKPGQRESYSKVNLKIPKKILRFYN